MLTFESSPKLENGDVFITESKLKSVASSVINAANPYYVHFKGLDLSFELEKDLKKILTVKEINLLATYSTMSGALII
ncbi:hypothetical protein [Pseudidiomarina sediminum]|uniref:hypothetical protein n=1 Tax=Pseudidiomarina sediminum TaxID=431675 RepID=UPI001C945354|nr:hypothetical protein [Pseudidiomarina sediminum]MBY6062929.1 hypothetical protein [Pseudidiomarina sediminum]